MRDVEIVVRLPENLLERAKNVGVQIDEQIITILETDIKRCEAVAELRAITDQIQALPDHLKPTPEEIAEEIAAYWAEKEDNEIGKKSYVTNG